MRTLAIKQPAKKLVKQNQHQNQVQSLSHSPTVLQRKPGCPCGGGCPRCQEQALLQTKLKIGEPGDKYEREADRIADEVMRMPEPSVQRQVEPEEEKEIIQRKAITNRVAPSAQRREASEVPGIVHEVLNSPGQLLTPETRTFMESRFGHDFNQIRVHTDAKAAESAAELNAEAYTVKHNIVFATGRYAPDTQPGRQLLAHELIHVIQQRSFGIAQIQRQPQGSKRVPPGPGEYNKKEYRAWRKAHPKFERSIVGPWEPNALYARYTPQWFWDRGYVYAGRGGNIPWYWFEVWISDRNGGKEFRVWRTSHAGTKTTSNTTPQSPGSQTTPEPNRIDPNADRQALFGSIIAAREDVDIAFGEGYLVLYEDATVELFLEGTTQSYVFYPVQGGGYIVYNPDGRRLDKIWMIPVEDIPDPYTDAVE